MKGRAPNRGLGTAPLFALIGPAMRLIGAPLGIIRIMEVQKGRVLRVMSGLGIGRERRAPSAFRAPGHLSAPCRSREGQLWAFVAFCGGALECAYHFGLYSLL